MPVLSVVFVQRDNPANGCPWRPDRRSRRITDILTICRSGDGRFDVMVKRLDAAGRKST